MPHKRITKILQAIQDGTEIDNIIQEDWDQLIFDDLVKVSPQKRLQRGSITECFQIQLSDLGILWLQSENNEDPDRLPTNNEALEAMSEQVKEEPQNDPWEHLDHLEDDN